MNWGENIRPSGLVTAIATGALFLLLGISLSSNFAEPDFFSFINFGRQFWLEGGMPRRDIFSYLPTNQPLVLHEWLTWVLFYPVYTLWGAAPLQLLKYACGLLAAWFAYRASRDRGASRAGAFTGLFLASYVWGHGFPSVLARDFSCLFLAAAIALIEAYRSGRKGRGVLWGLMALFVLWANLHGGFVTGLMVLGIYATSETRRGRPCPLLWILLAGCLAVSLVNPYGWRLWPTVLAHGISPDPEGLEWMSVPKVIRIAGWEREIILFVMLAAAAVPLALFYGKRNRVVWMMLCIFGLLAVRSQRHIPFFVVCFGIYAPECLTAWFARIKNRPTGFYARTAIAVTAAACLVPAVYSAALYPKKVWTICRMGSPLALETPDETARVRYRFAYPVGAVSFIRENGLRGNILSQELVWGGYLAWKLFPQCRTAFDTRTETTFPPLVRRTYYNFMFGREGWQEIMSAYPPDMVITGARGHLRRTLRAHPGWQEAYCDPVCAVFIPERWPGSRLDFGE